ncbi:MAG: hypothetical protein Q9162_007045 [Coniocarpon cinnabarinum]
MENFRIRINEFGSLLSELTGVPQPSKPLASRPRQDGAVQNPVIRSQSPLKRKPEDAGVGHVAKVVKSSAANGLTNNSSRPTSSSGLASKANSLSANKDAHSGNVKPSIQTTKLAPQVQTAKSASPTTTKPPPKGSYRDMMAKARAAQANSTTQPSTLQAPVAKQPFTKIGRRKQERMDARKKAREGTQEGKEAGPAHAKSGAERSKQAAAKAGKKPTADPPVKKKKERAPLEYKGTMRGAGPIQSKTSSSKTKPSAGYSSASGSEREISASGKRYTYAAYSDEDDEDDLEEEEYDSGGSSDMEGGGFDALEAEEAASLRAAKKEDLEALKEEDAHRREKLERKNKLQQLAAKAKPTKY